MDGTVAAAVTATKRLEQNARVARRALRALQDELGHSLGTYVLAPGEQVTSEVLDFLRLAVDGQQQEVVIHVTARDTGTDQRENDERSSSTPPGSDSQTRVGVQQRNGRTTDRRNGVPAAPVHQSQAQRDRRDR